MSRWNAQLQTVEDLTTDYEFIFEEIRSSRLRSDLYPAVNTVESSGMAGLDSAVNA